MSDHFRGSFSLANKTPHALSSSKSIMGLIVYRRKKYGKEIESFTG